jgi:hypothetical protein
VGVAALVTLAYVSFVWGDEQPAKASEDTSRLREKRFRARMR